MIELSVSINASNTKDVATKRTSERKARRWKWRSAIENSACKLCESAREYYGGPFFGYGGKLKVFSKEQRPTLIPGV